MVKHAIQKCGISVPIDGSRDGISVPIDGSRDEDIYLI